MQDIIQQLHSHNLVCNASPGSGKTTLSIKCIESFDPKKCVIVTYNRALCESTGSRCSEAQTYTYHSLLGMVSNQVIPDDQAFDKCFKELRGKKPAIKHDVDLLVIDEAQDARHMFIQFVIFFCNHLITNTEDLKILVVGDEHQSLYDFFPINGSDHRYLTLANRVMSNVNHRPWRTLCLPTSYRLTTSISNFVNTISGRSIESTKVGPPVILVICDLYLDAGDVILGYMPTDNCDTMVLSQSLNQNSPAKGVVEVLVRNGIPVHVARSGVLKRPSMANEETMTCRNRVRFKTYCSSKGLQAHSVFVVNNLPLFADALGNQLYVALTRASHQLVVLHDYRQTSMSDLQQLQSRLTNTDLRIILKRKVPPSKHIKSTNSNTNRIPRHIDVRQVYSFIDFSIMQNLTSRIRTCVLKPGASDTTPVIESFDGGKTFTCTSIIINHAILLCVEYIANDFVLPHRVRAMISNKQQLDEDVRSILNAYIPKLHPKRTPECDLDNLCFFGFIALAIDMDNSTYVDMAFPFPGKHFARRPGAFRRMQDILSLIEPMKPLRFGQMQPREIRMNDRPLTIKTENVHIAESLQDGGTVAFKLESENTNEDFCVTAACRAQILINIFDGSMTAVDAPDTFLQESCIQKFQTHESVKIHQTDEEFISPYIL